MALTYTPKGDLGSKAPPFSLLGTDGKTHSLAEFSDRLGLLVIFMCNHCPYVIAVQERINELAKKYGPLGIGVIGINSNDPVKYPDDSMEEMKARAKEQGYVFPYVQDLTQDVAKTYGAVCTPDPYLYENVGGRFLLASRGRIDDSWKDPSKVTQTDLANAMDAILEERPVEEESIPAMGCSIKWKD